jgi:hypothetical protein
MVIAAILISKLYGADFFDLFLQSYPGADNSTTLTTTQGYRSVSNIKLIYIILFVSLSSDGMVSECCFCHVSITFVCGLKKCR